MIDLELVKEFLEDNNEYALNILLNIIEREISNNLEGDADLELAYQLKDIEEKLMKIQGSDN